MSSDITGTINSKKFGATGITDDLAREMRDNLGKHYMGIVEWKVNAVHEDADGNYKVDLVLTQVEPSTSSDLDDHLRELNRTLHYNRKVTETGPTLLDGDSSEPSVPDVLAAGAKHRPHPYLASTLSTDDTENGPVCDVCGLTAAAAVHSAQDVLPDPDFDPEDLEDEPTDDDPDDEEPEDPTPIRPGLVDPFTPPAAS